MSDASRQSELPPGPRDAAYLSTTRMPLHCALAVWAGLGLLSWLLIILPFLLG